MQGKKADVKLGKNDIRLGNFILTKEEHHYKMRDVAGMWSLRVGRFMAAFIVIEECLKMKNMKYIESLCVLLYAITTSAPDVEMVQDLHKAYMSFIDRMKSAPASAEEDQEALKDVERMHSAKESIKKIIQDGVAEHPQG